MVTHHGVECNCQRIATRPPLMYLGYSQGHPAKFGRVVVIVGDCVAPTAKRNEPALSCCMTGVHCQYRFPIRQESESFEVNYEVLLVGVASIQSSAVCAE